MGNLGKYRQRIDEIDKEIVELFEKRMETVSQVSDYKLKNSLPVLNSVREDEVIEKNINYLRNKELTPYLKDFFIKLMDISKDYQNNIMDRKNDL